MIDLDRGQDLATKAVKPLPNCINEMIQNGRDDYDPTSENETATNLASELHVSNELNLSLINSLPRPLEEKLEPTPIQDALKVGRNDVSRF